jgi:hypothetical protein
VSFALHFRRLRGSTSMLEEIGSRRGYFFSI